MSLRSTYDRIELQITLGYVGALYKMHARHAHLFSTLCHMSGAFLKPSRKRGYMVREKIDFLFSFAVTTILIVSRVVEKPTSVILSSRRF